MICFKSRNPLICNVEGYAIPFDPGWLCAVLEEAAELTEIAIGSVAADVAAAVSAYLQLHELKPVISTAEFERLVKAALCSIGYPEMAAAVRVVHPVQQRSLLECMHDPPLRNEADFFERLQRVIQHCHSHRVQRLDFSDLSACEDLLISINQVFPWHQPSGVREKVVAFVRRKITHLRWPQHLRCSIS